MDFSNINPSKTDFDGCNWQEIIKNADKKECWNYSLLFDIKVRDAIEKNNEKEIRVYSLLGIVTSLWIKPESRDKPFVPMMSINGYRTADLSDISDNQIVVLKEIFNDIDDAEFKARIADILWLLKKDFPMAKFAVKYYLESVVSLDLDDKWSRANERIKRAFVISISLKRTNCTQYVIDFTKKLIDSDIEKVPIHIFELFIEFGTPDDIARYLPIVESAAKNTDDFYISKMYWETAAKMYNALKNINMERDAYKNAAESLVKLANQRATSSKPDYISASFFIREAIGILKINGFRERVNDIHPILLEYEKLSTYNMKEVTITTEIPSEVLEAHLKNIQDAVSGQSTKNALSILSLIRNTPSLIMLKKQVLSDTNITRHLASVVKVNDEGHVVDTTPPDDSESLNKLVYEQARYTHIEYAEFFIEPARLQIAQEHKIGPSEISAIIRNSLFVPSGREMLFSKGLHAGLYGDYITAAHILIPQIENSIREILKTTGVITSTISANSIQNKYDLNTLLYKPELIEILGEDIVYDLRGLLIAHSGSNLRNLLAHGLIDYERFSSWEMKYLWWSTLRLCVVFLPPENKKLYITSLYTKYE